MTCTYAAYKRPSQKKIHRLKLKSGKKKYSKQIDRKKKAGVAILMSDKIDFKTKVKKETQKDTS